MYERATPVLECGNQLGSQERGATLYLTDQSAAQSKDISAAVNTVRQSLGSKKVKVRIRSTVANDSVRIGIVYWTQNEAATGTAVGFDEAQVTCGGDVGGDIQDGADFSSKIFEFPAHTENYEIRQWSASLGDVDVFCWEGN